MPRARARRMLRLVASIASVALVMTFTSSLPASADNPLCPSGSICLFRDSNFSGGRYVGQPGILRLSLAKYDNGANVDNSASSVINNTDRTYYLQERYYVPCLGPQIYVQPHSQIADFSVTRANYPDNATFVNDIFSCMNVQF